LVGFAPKVGPARRRADNGRCPDRCRALTPRCRPEQGAHAHPGRLFRPGGAIAARPVPRSTHLHRRALPGDVRDIHEIRTSPPTRPPSRRSGATSGLVDLSS